MESGFWSGWWKWIHVGSDQESELPFFGSTSHGTLATIIDLSCSTALAFVSYRFLPSSNVDPILPQGVPEGVQVIVQTEVVSTRRRPLFPAIGTEAFTDLFFSLSFALLVMFLMVPAISGYTLGEAFTNLQTDIDEFGRGRAFAYRLINVVLVLVGITFLAAIGYRTRRWRY